MRRGKELRFLKNFGKLLRINFITGAAIPKSFSDTYDQFDKLEVQRTYAIIDRFRIEVWKMQCRKN